MARWRRLLAGAAGAAGTVAAGAAARRAWRRWQRARLQTPDHEVVIADGAFELRRYPDLLVAQVVRRGSRRQALRAGFGLLADYMFAESREGGALPMTAPLLLDSPGEGWAGGDGEGVWRTRLPMPAELTRATLPPPGPDVEIVDLPARSVAVLRFSGGSGDVALTRKRGELRAWMMERGLRALAGVEYAYYSPPLTPPPLRHNEVMIEVR